jgi:hypothetical protein
MGLPEAKQVARPSWEQPTELELQILKILWDSQPMTVREVRAALEQSGRDLAHDCHHDAEHHGG